MDKRSKLAIFVMICLILSSLSLSNIGTTVSQGDEQFIPDIYYSQAEPPTTANGQHSTSVSSVTFQAGAHQVTADLYTPTSGGSFPGIVFGVGYTEMAIDVLQLEDVSNYKWIGESLASHGYVVLIVKYASSVTNILDLSSLREWINQTVTAITYLQQNVGKVDDDRIGVMGHAVGGAVAICTAAEDKRVKNVIGLEPTQLPGFQPSMYDKAALLSPVPLQVQSGPSGLAAAMTTYNSAGIPKQRVLIQSGAYEGFTDIGAYESGITIPIPWSGGEITFGTRQHNHSIYYSVSFLKYYLENDDDYYDFISNDYEETETILENPVPSLPDLEYTWTSTQENEQLDAVIVDVSAQPESVDLAGDARVTVIASVVPRGVGWGSSEVGATIVYPEGGQQMESMELNDSRDENAGGFEAIFQLERNHDTDDDIEVTVEAFNTNDERFLSDTIDIDVFSSSGSPVAELVIEKPAGEPGQDIHMSVGGSDDDGEVRWYKLSYGDGNKTAWLDLSQNPLGVSYQYADSDLYDVRLWVKDEYGAESAPVKITVSISQKPVAKLRVDGEVEVEKKVSFDGSGSSDPDDDELEYLFDFGDGQNSGWVNTPKVTHSYTTTEKYTASLTVRDEYGVESATVTKDVKVVEEKTGLEKIFSSAGSGLYLIVFILVVAIVGGVFFVFGGKDTDEPGAIGETDYGPPQPQEEETPAQARETGSQVPPPPPVPETVAKKEGVVPPPPPPTEQAKWSMPSPPGGAPGQKPPSASQRETPGTLPAPSSSPPKTTQAPPPPPPPDVAASAAPKPQARRANFAAPVLTEGMKRKIEERKRKQLAEAPRAPEPRKQEMVGDEGQEEKAEEKPPEPEAVRKDELPDNVQQITCPECSKEFKVQLPEKKKETGKTICPRCSVKFSFKRKDWDQEAPPKEESKDTLTFPKKPERRGLPGIDVIDIKKK